MSMKSSLLLALFLLLSSPKIKAQDFLDLRVPFLEVKSATMEEVLAELKFRWKIHVCLEKVPKESEDEKEPTISFKLENASIREILDALVRADPRYFGEVYKSHLSSASLINILPVRAKEDPDSVMNMKVQEVIIKDVTPHNAISQIDLLIPELAKKLHPQGVVGHTLEGIGARVRVFRVYFEFENITVREILNEIALRSGGVDGVFEKEPSRSYRWKTY